MELSIVIVNWNTKNLLEKCLLSIYRNVRNIKFEIIVVDNGSTDGSPKMVRDCFTEVLLIENKMNRGYSKANNQGIKKITGEFICLLNSDILVFENSIEKMVSFLKANGKVGATSCMQINPDGSEQFGTALSEPNLAYLISVELSLYRLFPKSRLWGRPLLSYIDHKKPHEVEVCPSAVIVMKREMVREVGLLDENIFFGAIDWDYSYRARKMGWLLYFYPDSRVVHYGGRSKKPIKRKLMAIDNRSQYYYYWKSYGRFRMNIFRWLLIICDSFKLIASLVYLLLIPKKMKIPGRIMDRIETYTIRLRISLSPLSFNHYDPDNL